MPNAPFRELTRAECEAVLGRAIMGRLAFTFRDRVDIEPIACVWDGDTLFLRTGPGSKMEVLQHHPWVAFEVDEVQGLYQWTSVVVKGTVYFLRPSGSAFDQQTWARGTAAIRRLEPRYGGPDDPLGDRTRLFRIHVDEVSGRAAG